MGDRPAKEKHPALGVAWKHCYYYGRGQTRTDMGKPRYILSVVRLPFRHSPAEAYYAILRPLRVLLIFA